MIAFAPILPAALLIFLAVAALLVTLLGLLRRARGSLLRGLGFVLLLILLAGPRWITQTGEKMPDIALIALDESPSMDIGNRAKLAQQALATLTADHTVQTRIVRFGAAGNDGTPLFAAIRDGLANIAADQLAGIIVISDGQATDPPSPLPHAAPLTALVTGRAGETDRELRLISAPEYGLVGHHVTLRLEIFDHGADDEGSLVPVVIRQNGAVVGTLNAAVGVPTDFKLKVATPGKSVVSLAAAPLPGEVSLLNDQAVFTLNGVRQRLNVLLVSGRPNQGVRSWRLLLKSDPAISLVHFTILRMPDEPLYAPLKDVALIPFPVRQLFEDDIGKFDLIILDQFENQGLLPEQYLGNIAEHIQAGGALLMEVGPEFSRADSLAGTPLAPILPVLPTAAGTITGAFSPHLTDFGQRHPVTAGLDHAAPDSPSPGDTSPWGDWYRQEATSIVSGVPLLTGIDQLPLLVLAHEGKGRVAMLTSDQFWLWTKSGHAGPALPLLRRTVHWLLAEPDLAANALDADIADGTLHITRRALQAGAPGSAVITNPAGLTQTINLARRAPGRFSATVPATMPGVWQVTAGGQTAFAAAGTDDPLEYQDLAATDAKLKLAITASRGSTIWLATQPTKPLASLIRPRHARQITGSRETPLAPPIPTCLILLCVLAFAWWRER
jgi:hypothetical protein